MSANNPKPAIVFDVDGTLLDTADFILSAFQHVIGKNDLKNQSIDFLQRLIGFPLAEIYQKLAPQFSPEQVEALCQDHVSFQRNNVALTKVYAGVRETLSTLYAQNVPMGIFTSRRSFSVLPTLKHGEIDLFFKTIIAGDHVVLGKPHPEGVQKAIAALGTEASRTFMVGDTDLDVLAGKNAGAKTIAVSWGMRGKETYSYGADFVIDSIQELPRIILETEHV